MFIEPRKKSRRRRFLLPLLLLIALGASAVLGLWDPSAVAFKLGLVTPPPRLSVLQPEARGEQGDTLDSGDIAGIGDSIDELDGVLVYYNGPVGNVSGRNLGPDGYNIGQKYQCVEFVKRYYYEALNHKMPDPWGHAKDFFAPGLPDGGQNTARGLRQYSNPSARPPARGDLLVFGGTLFNRYGHVAIVSGVSETEIEFIQQNPGPSAPSRERRALERLNTADGPRWRIVDERLLGWLRKE